MKTIEASALILLLLFAASIVSVSAVTSFSFGGKSGDWIKYELQETFSLAGEQSETIEFLNVTGTTVTVRATFYMGSLPMNKTQTVDLTSQDDFSMAPWFNARVYFIPGGLDINDSIYLGEPFGNTTIVGETTGSYAGADRRVIYANFTTKQGNNYTFYWDKQTGVLTEGTMVLGTGFTDVLVSDTNMWSPEVPWWLWIVLWIIIIIVIALGVLSSKKSIMKRFRRKRDA